MSGESKMKSEESSEKKKNMARKMKPIIEGDLSHYKTQDNFSKKDVAKERNLRKQEQGKMPKNNWIT